MRTAPLTQAKNPRTILAGPYGHPFHATAVIVPIGTWVCSLIFDIIALADPAADFAPPAARLLILIGLVGAAFAIVLGFLDWAIIPKRTKARGTGTTHMVLNLVATAVFLVSYLLRMDTDELPTTAWGASVAGVLLLIASGWLGGKLAHTYGVRVAGEATQAEGREPLP